MKLITTPSLIVARIVVNHLEILLESVPTQFRDIDTSGVHLLVGSFQNGREQGLSIYAHGVRLEKDNYSSAAYCISEARSSDSIVVYVGNWANNSSEAKWSKTRRSFDNGNYAEAAEFIRDDIFQKLQGQEESFRTAETVAV